MNLPSETHVTVQPRRSFWSTLSLPGRDGVLLRLYRYITMYETVIPPGIPFPISIISCWTSILTVLLSLSLKQKSTLQGGGILVTTAFFYCSISLESIWLVMLTFQVTRPILIIWSVLEQWSWDGCTKQSLLLIIMFPNVVCSSLVCSLLLGLICMFSILVLYSCAIIFYCSIS